MPKKTKKTTKKKTSAKTKKVVKKTKTDKAASKKTKTKKTTKTSARKVITKKSGKKTSMRMRRKSSRALSKKHLTAAEIAHFKQMLLKKWTEIIGDVSLIENEALKKSRIDAAGDLSSMPIHMADIGTDNFEQEFALGLMDSERKLLVEIRDALIRITERIYGICEGTGKPISKARLNANPWARYCIDYANMVEKGLIKEGQHIYDEDEESELEDELDELEDGNIALDVEDGELLNEFDNDKNEEYS